MSDGQDKNTWATIIERVTTILGLSALVVLAAGAAFTAVLIKTPAEKQLTPFVIMVGLLLTIVVMNMVYLYYYAEKAELTFRVRVARLSDGVEVPWDGARVDLLKNGQPSQQSLTDEGGYVLFTVKAGRKDEFSVIVVDPSTAQQKSSPAPLFAQGHCLMPKKILLS